MTVAISGIGGFLGARLAQSLPADFTVIGISTSAQSRSFPVFGFGQLDQIKIVPDAIVHCHAAVASGTTVLDAQTLEAGNITPTKQLIDRFPQARHLYISSVSVYGNPTGIITENTVVNPQTDYAKSKSDAEQLIESQAKSAIIRLSSLYGEGMKENTLIPNYVNQALQNNVIEVWGTGARRQNYFHVDDAAALVKAVLQSDHWNHPVFLGVSDGEFSNLELAQIIAGQTGASVIHKNSDSSLSAEYNNTFTQNSLNWHPQTQFTKALKAYIQWKKRQS